MPVKVFILVGMGKVKDIFNLIVKVFVKRLIKILKDRVNDVLEIKVSITVFGNLIKIQRNNEGKCVHI